MGLAITNKTLDKYFGFLRRLDNNSKKRLIIKLAESIETNDKGSSDLRNMFGAWEDSKDSDEIIRQIRESRVDSSNTEHF
ncbi:MAG: hypothetical protein JW894_14005 [Bacteroidales bacterium]|nr:hypothetical protein [Bacteroidales bacterium]